MIVAGMTSFYMFRLLILTFMGRPRYTHHDVHHVHESPTPMLIPLIVLAFFSIVAGYVGVPRFITGHHEPIVEFLQPVLLQIEAMTVRMEWILMLASVAAAGIGLALAYVFYVKRPELPARVSSSASALYSILTNKYYVDEIYDAILVLPIVARGPAVPLADHRRCDNRRHRERHREDCPFSGGWSSAYANRIRPHVRRRGSCSAASLSSPGF